MNGVDFRLNPPIDSPALNELYRLSWPRHVERDDYLDPVLPSRGFPSDAGWTDPVAG